MARDPARRLAASECSPVEQLEVWRDWRRDTVEFPVVDDQVRVGRPRRSRSRVGVLGVTTLLLGALVLSGLAALGVGPVARLIGSGDDAGARHGGPPAAGATPGRPGPAGRRGAPQRPVGGPAG